MSEELQNNQEYGADQIQILEGLEAVRDRECISEAHPQEDFIIWFMRSWIMQWMKHLPVIVRILR